MASNDSTPPAPTPRPMPEGLCCPKCGATEFKTFWQTFANGTKHVRADCAACGAFVRYLKQDGAPEPKYEPKRLDAGRYASRPPASDASWIGWIRQDDKLWRPVALAPTLGNCWDTLLHYPGDGDRLCIPVKPGDYSVAEAAPSAN